MNRIRCIDYNTPIDDLGDRIRLIEEYLKEFMRNKEQYNWDWSGDDYAVIEIADPEVATAFRLKFGI